LGHDLEFYVLQELVPGAGLGPQGAAYLYVSPLSHHRSGRLSCVLRDAIGEIRKKSKKKAIAMDIWAYQA